MASVIEDDDLDEEEMEISVRDITEQERKLLDANKSDYFPCQGANVHVWKLQNDMPNVCSFFSQLEVNKIAFGGEHTLVLTSNGCLYSEGSNEYGQLGVGDTNPRDALCKINSFTKVEYKEISCGARHNAVVCEDGSLYCWGDSREGQCGIETLGIFTTPIRINFAPLVRSNDKASIQLIAHIIQVSCAETFTACVDSRGSVWTWGKGAGLGHGLNVDQCLLPTLVKGLRQKKVMQIACGSFHCVAVTQDDFEDNELNLLSPDYRAASVSSAYYAGLQIRKDTSASRIPFLQTTFYSSGDETEFDLHRSHSDTELDTHFPEKMSLKDFGETVSISEVDLASAGTCNHSIIKEKWLQNKERLLSPDTESVTSSQYYSTAEGFSDDVESLRTNKDRMEKSSSSGESIKEIEELMALANPVSEADKEKRTSEYIDDIQQTNSEVVFEGKKSIFSNLTKKTSDSLETLRNFSLVDSRNDENLVVYGSELSPFGTFDSVVSTEVWSWGKNNYGQLGHNDDCESFTPRQVEKLKGMHIQCITAGSYHTLAITVDGEVFSWGDNTFGQIGHSSTNLHFPKRIKVLKETRVWDVAAGRNYSLFLGDFERNKTEVFFCGEVGQQKVGRTISNPIIEIPANDKRTNDGRWKSLSRRVKRTSDYSVPSNFIDVQLRKLVHFHKDEVVRFLSTSDYSFACVCVRLGSGHNIEPIYKFARAERLFREQLRTIQKLIIEPLIKTDSWTHVIKLTGGEALIPLIDSFVDLMHGITTELKQLTDVVKHSLPTQELFSYLFSDSFRAVYDRYSQCFCDALAVGVISQCNKPASNIISKVKDTIKGLEKHLSITQVSFEGLLKAPLLRSHVYCDIAKRISSHCANKTETDHLKEVISRWLQFSDINNKRLVAAGVTKKFWNESNQRLNEALKDPKRRVLKSSKTDPLGLSRASRLSSHSYILCNDVFVHVQFNRNFQVFSLITLWADSLPDGDYTQNAIKIMTPEETFTLSAGTPDGKIAWLSEINNAVASCLEACSTFSLDLTVNLSTGLLKAAVAREATYRYVNHPIFKSASYKGMWMAGVPHGRGTMTWEDGSCYEGEFVKGQFHGYGQMVWPKNSSNAYEKVYKGDWCEGKMRGRGVMKYGQGEEYIGSFKDDVRHGHGTLRTSLNKTSLDTIYVGDWMNDMRSGYGVLDYIIRGEKYMGMWSNDQRHGHGVVVTVDGVYYEGKFFQNRLAGRGLLLSEDDTCYEGEFTADMLLSGKGVLTLPNGDFFDGAFYGNWGETIKVNGVFSKFTNPLLPRDTSDLSQGNRLGTTDFTIDADAKWNSLFQECLASLGCEDNHLNIDPETAWKHVTDAVVKAAGSMTSMSRHPTARFDIDFVRQTCFDEQMNLAHNLKGLQDYLSQVFDTCGHPLNTLVEGLIEVYRATYVGVGAHRRLLPHAVAEAKSYVTRLFNVLRILFPDLHDEDFVLLTNDTVDGIMDPPVNSMSLLHPLLLPRLYPPLFTLYALMTEKTDAAYTEKLYYLNKRGDVALLSFLGVQKKFWLLPPEELGNKETEVVLKREHHSYAGAVETLEEISTTYSPMDKIEIIRRTFAKIHEEIIDYYDGVRQLLAMDDLFPLFQYIVIRARVPHLGSEIRFIEDLVDQSVLVGEAGHMVTTLSACYYQIQNERDRD